MLLSLFSQRTLSFCTVYDNTKITPSHVYMYPAIKSRLKKKMDSSYPNLY